MTYQGPNIEGATWSSFILCAAFEEGWRIMKESTVLGFKDGLFLAGRGQSRQLLYGVCLILELSSGTGRLS